MCECAYSLLREYCTGERDGRPVAQVWSMVSTVMCAGLSDRPSGLHAARSGSLGAGFGLLGIGY